MGAVDQSSGWYKKKKKTETDWTVLYIYIIIL